MRPWELHPPSLELQLLELLELELFELLVELLVELEMLKWTFRSQEVARTCGSIGEAPGKMQKYWACREEHGLFRISTWDWNNLCDQVAGAVKFTSLPQFANSIANRYFKTPCIPRPCMTSQRSCSK